MKICLAQTTSFKGDIEKSFSQHLSKIHQAIGQAADLIVFPELSITGYETKLAKSLATTVNDSIFDTFERIATRDEITICIGMPIQSVTGKDIYISMLIFQPHQERKCYSKQLLHTDEKPYFVEGSQPMIFTVKSKKIAPGICYETLQLRHLDEAIANKADIYLASVAKSVIGLDTADLYYQKIAAEYTIPVLMVNAVGPCDNFVSAGQSAVWNEKGKLAGRLKEKESGLLFCKI